MAKSTVKDPLLDNVIWSEIEYQLFNFVDRFLPPQIVKVQEGYYGPTEESCIGAEQILTFHCVKSTEKVIARDRKKRELNIPLNCSQRVELRHANFRGVYETVAEISKIPTKFVRITQGHYGLDDGEVSLNPGDKLEIIRVEHGISGKEDCILFLNEERKHVRLPFSVSAGFQSLFDGREYYLKELVEKFKLPVYFQFIDPPSLTRRSAENVFNSSLGVLELVKKYADETVICTTKEGNTRTVVSCPKHLPITVCVARGALSDDKDYVRICRSFHDGVSLSKIENMEIQNIYASRDTIREYEYVEVLPPPPVPPHGRVSDDSPSSVKKHVPVSFQNSKEKSDDIHDYLEIDDYPSPPGKSNGSQRTNGSGSKPTSPVQPVPPVPPVPKRSSVVVPQNDGDDDYIYIPVDDDKFPDPPPAYEPEDEPVKIPNLQETESDVKPPKKKPPPLPVKPKRKPKPGNIKMPSTEQQDCFIVPDDLSKMTVEEVSKFLIHYNLKDYVEVFANDQVDGSLLICLNEDELKSLGMTSFQCKKVLKLIAGWRPKR